MFERVKTIKGRGYRYLVKNVRDGKKVKQKVVDYLGPVDPIYQKNKKRSGGTRKTNASIYIRSLKKDEIKILKKATKSNIAFTRDRAKILLFSSKGFFSGQIADKIGCEPRKVRNAVKAFNTKGLKALERGKAKGEVALFSQA